MITDEFKSARELINKLVQYARDDRLIFRGVSNSEQLKPTINRVISRATNFKQVDLAQEEFQLLYDFKKYTSSMLNGNLELLDIVAYAQHFGLPTRLIDWTRDPFVALYFAVNQENAPEDGYKIYYVNIDEHMLLNRSFGGFTHGNLTNGSEFIDDYFRFIESIKDKKTIADKIKERHDKLSTMGINEPLFVNHKGLLFFECNASNPRLIAQQGLFSIPESIIENRARYEIEGVANQIRIKLDKKQREQVLKFLDNMNYSNLRLFPDIASISSYIVEDNIKQKEPTHFE